MDGEVVAAVALAVVGLAANAFVAVVYWLNRDTPIVKASSRELTYIMLMGMFGAYASTLPLVAVPNPSICGLAFVLPALSLAVMYSSLATKTNRIARILAVSKKRVKRRHLKFLTWPAQVSTCGFKTDNFGQLTSTAAGVGEKCAQFQTS
jgi:hypothetical protein